MKKLIALLISVSMLVCMSACGKTLPEGMSQELYDTSVKALEIMDKYNDMDIDVDDAYDRIQVIYDKIENMNISDEPNEDEIWTESDRALFIKSDISLYKHALFCIKCGEKNNTSSDIYTIADELRKELELD